MPASDTILFEGDTEFDHYQVIDTTYEGRPARVLYGGHRTAALSGVAQDSNPDLLFDYNQRFFELISGLQLMRILVIGGGVYTLPMALLQDFTDMQVDVVEPDAGLDVIAREFFGLKSDPRLHIVHDDGRAYLDTNTTPYDMIVVDAFMSLEVPQSLATLAAAQQLKRNLRTGGIAAMNIIAAYRGRNEKMRRQYGAFKAVFGTVQAFPASHSYSLWLPQNIILTGQKGKSVALAEHMRYETLPPLA